MKNYVIIGGGIASLGCIDGIRKHDKDGKITLICGEKHLPYSRPLISYYLENLTTPEKMTYRTEGDYESQGVEIKLGVKAEKIGDGTVLCEGGEKIPFDSLAVATGSSPFVPPIKGLETVKDKFTFMTLSDALSLEGALGKDKKVLIIGAGLIGLKCAEGISGRVGKITVCDLAPKVLSSILDDEAAKEVQKKLEENGIEFMLSDTAESFDGNTASMKSGKTVKFDILCLCVGVRPNLALLKDAGAEINRGVLVSDRMKTSVKNIYAAGDITESIDTSCGERKIMAILPNAYIGGLTAGENIAGTEKSFTDKIPMNSIGFFGYHIMTAGSYGGEMSEIKSGENIRKFFTNDNRLTGFILLGDIQKAGIYTAIIQNKTPIDSINFDKIKENPSFLTFLQNYRRKIFGGVV